MPAALVQAFLVGCNGTGELLVDDDFPYWGAQETGSTNIWLHLMLKRGFFKLPQCLQELISGRARGILTSKALLGLFLF